MTFAKEAQFEEAVIQLLKDHGWEDKVLKNATEKDLIQNWADILFENNRGIDQTEQELAKMIDDLTGNEYDMKGLEAFKSLLGY